MQTTNPVGKKHPKSGDGHRAATKSPGHESGPGKGTGRGSGSTLVAEKGTGHGRASGGKDVAASATAASTPAPKVRARTERRKAEGAAARAAKKQRKAALKGTAATQTPEIQALGDAVKLMSEAVTAVHAMSTGLATQKAQYNTGLYFGQPGVHYVADSAPIEPGNSVAVVDLSGKSDLEVASFLYEIIENAKTNPYVTLPPATVTEMTAIAGQFTDGITQNKSLMELCKSSTQQKAQLRTSSEGTIKTYQRWLQDASKGNAAVINAGGLPVKKAPIRKGELPSPTNFMASPAPFTGGLDLSWNLVAGSRSYIVRCAVRGEPGEPLVWEQLKATNKRKLRLEGLKAGSTYVFQVAATGGSTGQSAWSPEISRVCA